MKRPFTLPASWAIVCLAVAVVLVAGIFILDARYTHYQQAGHTIRVDRWTDTETYTSHGYAYTRSPATGGRWEKVQIGTPVSSVPPAKDDTRQLEGLLKLWEESKDWSVSKDR